MHTAKVSPSLRHEFVQYFRSDLLTFHRRTAPLHVLTVNRGTSPMLEHAAEKKHRGRKTTKYENKKDIIPIEEMHLGLPLLRKETSIHWIDANVCTHRVVTDNLLQGFWRCRDGENPMQQTWREDSKEKRVKTQCFVSFSCRDPTTHAMLPDWTENLESSYSPGCPESNQSNSLCLG